MTFPALISHIKNALPSTPLRRLVTSLLMRLPPTSPSPSTAAAVNLILLNIPSTGSCVLSSTHIVLTKRPLSLHSHAGQICLPGGKFDAADTMQTGNTLGLPAVHGRFVHTALRETAEELGSPAILNWDDLQILGLTAPVPSITKVPVYTLVTATSLPTTTRDNVIAALSSTANSDEVQQVGLLSLQDLLTSLGRTKTMASHASSRRKGKSSGMSLGKCIKSTVMRAVGRVVTTPSFKTELGECWGLTGYILYGFGVKILKPYAKGMPRKEI